MLSLSVQPFLYEIASASQPRSTKEATCHFLVFIIRHKRVEGNSSLVHNHHTIIHAFPPVWPGNGEKTYKPSHPRQFLEFGDTLQK